MLSSFFHSKAMTERCGGAPSSPPSLHHPERRVAAWVAERKNVLSTFSGFQPWRLIFLRPETGGRSPFWVFVTLTVGLTAKPMLVTAPFVLLLLDHGP